MPDFSVSPGGSVIEIQNLERHQELLQGTPIFLGLGLFDTKDQLGNCDARQRNLLDSVLAEPIQYSLWIFVDQVDADVGI